MDPSKSDCKVVVMTGDELRHRYFCQEISRKLDVAGIVSEVKYKAPAASTEEENEIIKKHFSQRDESEKKYFAACDEFPLSGDRLLRVEHSRINEQDVFEWVEAIHPDILLLFGTSIVKPPLLSRYDGRVVNMHLGLSPYYRGSGTNYWPLVHGVPECVGVTVHLATLEVDAGGILGQARPVPDAGDGCHDLGNKTIIAGAALAAECAARLHAGTVSPVIQQGEGVLCKRKDFTAESVLKMWDNFSKGMMRDYIADIAARKAAYSIVEVI